MITRRQVGKVPQKKWHQVAASSFMVPLDKMVAVDPEEAAYNVVELMESKCVKEVLVNQNSLPLGFIARDGVRRFIRIHARSRTKQSFTSRLPVLK